MTGISKKFYIYQYLRSKKSKYGEIGSPYYVGKGSNGRAYSKQRRFKPPTDKSNIIISTLMTEIDAFQVEILLIHLYGRISTGTGCLRNLTIGGEGTVGVSCSTETRQKISASKKGVKLPPVSDITRKKLSEAALRRKPVSDISRKKLSEAKKGNKHCVGRKLSSTTLEKIATAKKDFRHTEESKKKMSLAKQGKKASDQTKENMRNSQLGRVPSEETRAKMSTSQKRRQDLIRNINYDSPGNDA